MPVSDIKNSICWPYQSNFSYSPSVAGNPKAGRKRMPFMQRLWIKALTACSAEQGSASTCGRPGAGFPDGPNACDTGSKAVWIAPNALGFNYLWGPFRVSSKQTISSNLLTRKGCMKSWRFSSNFTNWMDSSRNRRRLESWVGNTARGLRALRVLTWDSRLTRQSFKNQRTKVLPVLQNLWPN